MQAVTNGYLGTIGVLERSVGSREGLNKFVKFVSGTLTLLEYTCDSFKVLVSPAIWEPTKILRGQLRQVVDVTDLLNPIKRANDWFGKTPFWIGATKAKVLGRLCLTGGHIVGFVDTLRNWGFFSLDLTTQKLAVFVAPATQILNTTALGRTLLEMGDKCKLGVLANASVFGSAVFGMIESHTVMRKCTEQGSKIEEKLIKWGNYAVQIASATDPTEKKTLITDLNALVLNKQVGISESAERSRTRRDELSAELKNVKDGRYWFTGWIRKANAEAELRAVNSKIKKLEKQSTRWGNDDTAGDWANPHKTDDERIASFTSLVTLKQHRWTQKKINNYMRAEKADVDFWANTFKATLLAIVVGKDLLGYEMKGALKGTIIALAFFTNASSWWKTAGYDLNKEGTKPKFVHPLPGA